MNFQGPIPNILWFFVILWNQKNKSKKKSEEESKEKDKKIKSSVRSTHWFDLPLHW